MSSRIICPAIRRVVEWKGRRVMRREMAWSGLWLWLDVQILEGGINSVLIEICYDQIIFNSRTPRQRSRCPFPGKIRGHRFYCHGLPHRCYHCCSLVLPPRRHLVELACVLMCLRLKQEAQRALSNGCPSQKALWLA